WLGACAPKDDAGAEAETQEPTTDPTSPPAEGTTTSEPPGSTGPTPGGTTQVDPGSSSSAADEADTGPGVHYDLGTVPDMPNSECEHDVDIVFVMDVSTTMAGFINMLADEMLAVDAAIQALDLPSPPNYGLAVFVDDALLV